MSSINYARINMKTSEDSQTKLTEKYFVSQVLNIRLRSNLEFTFTIKLIIFPYTIHQGTLLYVCVCIYKINAISSTYNAKNPELQIAKQLCFRRPNNNQLYYFKDTVKNIYILSFILINNYHTRALQIIKIYILYTDLDPLPFFINTDLKQNQLFVQNIV